MSRIDNNTPCKGLQTALDAAAFSVTTAEPLEKMTKIFFRGFDLIELMGCASKALMTLSTHLKNTVTVFEGINLVNRVKELACPDENGKYFFAKNSESGRWQKSVDRIFLTASSIFKMMNAAIRFGFIHLAQLAKMTFGRIPILRLIPDTLVALSSFFSILDNTNEVRKTSKGVLKASAKTEKWAQRPELIEQIRKGNVDEIAKLKSYYQGRVISLEKDIDALDPKLKKAEMAKANAAYKKYQARLDMIGDQEHVKLADELAKQNIKFKQAKWSIVQSNEAINLNKAWLGITSGVSKIFVITVASAMTTLSLLSAPYAMSLLSIGITVDSIGLTKTLYDFCAKTEPVPVA